MKNTRKVLSLFLAMIVAISSMPVVYTSTAAAETVPYAIGEKGTIDNPTQPVEVSGETIADDDDSAPGTVTGYLNSALSNLNYTYYQTKNDEYFSLEQILKLQKKHYLEQALNIWGPGCSDVTLTIEKVDFTHEINSGRTIVYCPQVVTQNDTDVFLNNRLVSSVWTPINDDAAELGGNMSNFGKTLYGVNSNTGGCPEYLWQDDIVFTGLKNSEKNEMNLVVYQSVYTSYSNSRSGISGTADIQFPTNIKVLDARELAKEIAKAEDILANAENYTDAYISSVKLTLNTIPEDLREFTKVYDQSVIDSYTQMLKDVSLNAADYREFNETYKALKSITNAKGAYTDESFESFKAELDRINKNLPKSLDKTQQATVDAATQALKDAFELLISTDLGANKVPYEFDAGDKKDIVIQFDNTVYYFMQTEDNQVFSYDQNILVYRTGGSTARKIRGIILDETGYHGSSSCSDGSVASTGTSTFISHLESSSYASTNGYTDENGASVSAKEFTCVTETENDNWRANQNFDTSFVTNDGRFGYNKTLDDFGVFGSGPFEYRSAVIKPVFRGNANGTYGELVLNYTMRAGFSTNSGLGYSAQQWHTHTRTTLNITDVRQLIAAVDEAKKDVASDKLTESQRTALQAAVDSVPVEMLRGVEYFTQAEVDKYYNDITAIPTDVADYSKFVEVFDMMTSLNKDNYSEESYNSFIEEIYEINKNLPKNLTADKQSVIDAAVDALYAAQDKLASIHLNDDKVFTQDDIDGLNETNSPLEFSLSSTEYNYMMIADGQKFTIRTELEARKTRTNYNLYLRGIGFWNAVRDVNADYCKPHEEGGNDGCYYLEDVVGLTDAKNFVNEVDGLDVFTESNIHEIHKGAGNMAEHNTWTNVKGPALSSNGVLSRDGSISTTESAEYAEMYYHGPVGGETKEITANYSLWLGWWYKEPFIIEAWTEETYRHAHIPVSVKITDARALNALYGEVEDIVNGKTDTNYTLDSLVNLYEVFDAINADMANGKDYFTQEEVNAEYAKLKEAYDGLQSGADYSEYFEAYVKAQEIIETNNDDGYGNKLYDDSVFNEFKATVESIDDTLEKNLDASTENQNKINNATTSLSNAIATLEATKKADYTDLEKAIIEAEKIVNAEDGTYTDATLDMLKEVLESAKEIDRNLPASEQTTVDDLTSALEAAIAEMDFKADYSEYDEAYNKVQDIINNPDKYTEETVKAAEAVMGTVGDISKDLADTAANRVIIKEATDALNNMLNSAEEKANYSGFDEAYKQIEDILNNSDEYTSETVENAQAAKDAADALGKDQPASNQDEVNSVINAMKDAVANKEEKADYSDFDEVYKQIEDILNNSDEYTSETVENAQAAKDAADALGKDQPASNQDEVNSVINAMKDAVDNRQEKADYSGFDEAYEQIEDILNNPDKYTSETVKNAQAAKDAADALGKDQPASNQDAVNDVTNAMNQVIADRKDKADYTEYNQTKEAADNLANDDGYGNTVYDEDLFNAYKDAVNEIDNSFSKELSESEQAIVDEKTQALKDLRTELDASKGYDETIIESETTVDEIKQEIIQNGGYNPDEIIVEIKDYTGKELASEEFVGTGSTLRVILKSTGELLDYKLFIIMGDVNGDGVVDEEDYQISINVCLHFDSYEEENYYFFIANDVDEDGVIDVIDTSAVRLMVSKLY